ncbi:uncharacterized protein [Maniola hyperantus]|uniref:uncharacterized protein n=1 Tax=Aphantopus hyperantus TaxID=2795564 RepID=UPI00374A4D39
MSDSEYEFAVPPAKVKKPRKSSTPAKVASKQTSEEPARSRKGKLLDIFGLQSDDDEGGAVKSLPSFIVNRVANGVQRRSVSTTGPFYLELRVYDRCDAEATESDERWKKALLRLACSVDDDSSQWKALQRLVKELHELFKDSDPTFMSGNFNFKKR